MRKAKVQDFFPSLDYYVYPRIGNIVSMSHQLDFDSLVDVFHFLFMRLPFLLLRLSGVFVGGHDRNTIHSEMMEKRMHYSYCISIWSIDQSLTVLQRRKTSANTNVTIMTKILFVFYFLWFRKSRLLWHTRFSCFMCERRCVFFLSCAKDRPETRCLNGLPLKRPRGLNSAQGNNDMAYVTRDLPLLCVLNFFPRSRPNDDTRGRLVSRHTFSSRPMVCLERRYRNDRGIYDLNLYKNSNILKTRETSSLSSSVLYERERAPVAQMRGGFSATLVFVVCWIGDRYTTRPGIFSFIYPVISLPWYCEVYALFQSLLCISLTRLKRIHVFCVQVQRHKSWRGDWITSFPMEWHANKHIWMHSKWP